MGGFINQLIMRNVAFNNIAYGGVTIYLLENTFNGYMLLENCLLQYTATITTRPLMINMGTVDLKGCKFVNTQAYFSQVIYNATSTTVNAYNSTISNFGTLLYYSPPSGAVANSFNTSAARKKEVHQVRKRWADKKVLHQHRHW
jgi:hypothetical protein